VYFHKFGIQGISLAFNFYLYSADMRARMLQCLRKATAQLKIITKKTQHLSLPLQKCSLASKQYSTDLFRQYFSTSFSTSVACHVEHVIGPWKSSPAKRPGITSHYCARMQNSGDDYRSSRIFNSCPGPEGLGRSNYTSVVVVQRRHCKGLYGN